MIESERMRSREERHNNYSLPRVSLDALESVRGDIHDQGIDRFVEDSQGFLGDENGLLQAGLEGFVDNLLGPDPHPEAAKVVDAVIAVTHELLARQAELEAGSLSPVPPTV
jgi:hypothetical protein